MATLPEPYVPDVMQGIRAHQAGYAFGREQQQNALAQRAGGMAAGGDFGGAANALLQGGDLQGGFGIQDRVRAMAKEANDQDLAKSARANDLFFRLATVADTPEKWQTAIGHLRSMGADTTGFDDFGSRDMAMARFGQTKDVLGTVLEERKARAISGALMPSQGAQQGARSVVDRIEGNESGGNPTATNPRSSATGSGQFIDSTWLATIKRARPDIAQGRSDAELLALRSNRELSRAMIGAYAEENGRALQQAGFAPTDANTYLAHFAGPGGAVAVLRANPAVPVEQVLGRKFVEANPFLATMSAGDLVAWAGRKMGGQSAAAQPNALAPQQQGAGRLDYDAGIRAAIQAGDYETASRIQALKTGGSKAQGRVQEVQGRLVAEQPDGTFKEVYAAPPRAKNLTVQEQKEVFEADEGAEAARNVIGALDAATELNKTAYSGPTAQTRGYLTSLAGYEGGENTEKLQNVILGQVLDNLKATFGAAPTEGERQILIDLQGSVNKAEKVRQAIFDRAKVAAEKRLRFNQEKAAALRGGEYFQAGYDPAGTRSDAAPVRDGRPTRANAGQAPETSAVPTVTQAEYAKLSSGAQYIAADDPSGQVRTKR